MGFVEFYNSKDNHIWDEFREGNPHAFEIIYERHINVLANYGRRICLDDEMVKDAIQDLFINLWRNKKNLNDTDSIKYYLLKAYRRNLIKKITSARKFNSHDEAFNVFDGAFELSHELILVEAEEENEKLNQLTSEINKLPDRQKEAIFLRFYGDLNYTEISRIMEINQQSAYNMVFRALEVLRDKMVYALSSLLFLLQG